MLKVNFFTPVTFGSHSKTYSEALLEQCDNYFYLGGRKAHVIPNSRVNGQKGTLLRNDTTPFFTTMVKVISYATIILPLIVLIAKALLRSMHPFYIDVKAMLEEGVDVSRETLEKISSLTIEQLENPNEHELIVHVGYGPKYIFSFKSDPHLIFTFWGSSRNGRRHSPAELYFKNMIKAEKACLMHQLDLLIIPRGKIVEVNGHSFIVQKLTPVDSSEKTQEHLYKTLSHLDETVRQLALFIIKTGFNGTHVRKMPIIDQAPEFVGNRRVALMDLELMDGPEEGIYGYNNYAGLLYFFYSEAQVDSVLREAERHEIFYKTFASKELKNEILACIEKRKKRDQFHVDHGIVANPLKPFTMTAFSELDLQEQGQYTSNGKTETITLGEVAQKVIDTMNQQLAESSDQDSLYRRRNLSLDFRQEPLKSYAQICNSENTNLQWIERILEVLKEKGSIFDICKEPNGHYKIHS